MKRIKLLIVALGVFITGTCMFSASTNGINAVYWCAWGGNTSFNLGTDYLPPVGDITSLENGKIEGNKIVTDPITLDKISDAYNVIIVSFIVDYEGKFVIQNFGIDPNTKKKIPGPWSYDDIKGFIKNAKANNKDLKVTAALGGALGDTPITEKNVDAFIKDVKGLITEFDFDGIDLDLESGTVGASESKSIKKALLEFRKEFGNDFILSMIPEYPAVKTTSVYGKLIEDKELDFTYIGFQYYNQYGEGINTDPKLFDSYYISASNCKDNIPKFIAAVTWAFATPDGNSKNQFPFVPADKIVIGLPSAVGAAGNMSTTPQIRKDSYSKVTEILKKAEAEKTKVAGFANWSADFDNLISTGKDTNGYFNHQQWSYGKSVKEILDSEKAYEATHEI
jgi:chitinase